MPKRSKAERQAAMDAFLNSPEMNELWEREREHQLEQERVLAHINDEMSGVHIGEAGGMAPFQMTGSVDGVRFYLRERHDRFTLSVSRTGDPVGGLSISEGGADELYGGAFFGEGTLERIIGLVVDRIRDWDRVESCTHKSEPSRFCPDCGARLQP